MPEPAPRSESLKGRTILVVTDNEYEQQFYQSVLELHGCTVVTATSVPDALTAYKQNPPDHVLVDYLLGGLGEPTGLDLARLLRQLPQSNTQQQTPIIVQSAFPIDELNRLIPPQLAASLNITLQQKREFVHQTIPAMAAILR